MKKSGAAKKPQVTTDDLCKFDSMAQAIKVASVVVHVEESLSKDGHPLDQEALRGLVADPDVQTWLKQFPAVLLPLKRH